MTKSIIIMAAGASSRMKKSAAPKDLSRKYSNSAQSKNKVLIEFGSNSKPFISFLIKNVIESGFEKIYVVTSESAYFFRENFNKILKIDFKKYKINFSIQYIHPGRIKPMGTSDAICQTMEQFPNLKSESFCVCNGDNIYTVESLKKIRSVKYNYAFIAYDKDGLGFSSEKISSFSIVNLNNKNHLVDIIEKPKTNSLNKFIDSLGKIRVNMNLLKFQANDSFYLFKNCPINKKRNEKEIADVLKLLIRDKKKVFGIPVFQNVYDLTSKNDIIKIQKILK